MNGETGLKEEKVSTDSKYCFGTVLFGQFSYYYHGDNFMRVFPTSEKKTNHIFRISMLRTIYILKMTKNDMKIINP